VQDAEIVARIAGRRPVVELAHPRQRTDGAVGVLWRAGSAVVLCAHRCELTELPAALESLSELERLDVGANRLSELPALPPRLRELYVHDNQLARLPALPRLSVLDANRNRLDQVAALADIDFVYLAANRLTEPPAITGVRYLNVSDNPLGHLELADPALHELRAEQAQLRTLSFELPPGRPPGLRELSLRGNQLTVLPPSIDRLSELRALDLRGNQLDGLPETLRGLPLGKLDLRWNPLRARPAWLDELASRGCLVYV
jgi:Leucine-rich repeat (LRR) protein